MELDIEENTKRIIMELRNINRKGFDELIDYLIKSDYFIAPASSMHHLNIKGGLAQHSLNVLNVALNHNKLLIKPIEEKTIVLVSLLHDVCKINFYKENILKSGNISDSKPYLVEDKLPVGHSEKSIFILQKYIELTDEEIMLIRWHMGAFDRSYNQNESYIKKVYPEALLLHFADWFASLYLDNMGDKDE